MEHALRVHVGAFDIFFRYVTVKVTFMATFSATLHSGIYILNKLKILMPKSIKLKDAKNKFSELVNKAHYGGQQFLVTKHDVPCVVIIGVSEYEDLIDQLDTMAEQVDIKFQKSLERGMEEFRKGEYGTVEDISSLLTGKRAASSKKK